MRRNYHRKLWGEIITGNYEGKLSQEIMRRNHHRKLSASIYHHAKNVGIIGILPYPEIKLKRKRENRRAPLPFRGKRAENCLHNVGKSLGEGLAELKFRSFTVSEFQSFFVRWRRTYVLNKQIINIKQITSFLVKSIFNLLKILYYKNVFSCIQIQGEHFKLSWS